MNFNLTITRKELTTIAVAWIAVVGVCVLGWVHWRFPDVTPEEARHGWSADAFAAEETQTIVGEMPAFEMLGPDGQAIVQDNSHANVRLWEAVIAKNGGHLTYAPQQVGDCVSHAFTHAGDYLECVDLETGEQREFHRLYPPYTYGVSRVDVGKGKIKGDGSCMAWAVKGAKEHGVLRADAAGCPPYSGAIARAWGKSGPPAEFRAVARDARIQESSQVTSASAVRDAICNGYPVPFGAGKIGFDKVVERKGRLVADPPSGSWAHAQVVIGYDGSTGVEEPLFCILNSWGPLAGGKSPTDGSPPGSYWITARSMDFIAKQGDAFAISGFTGFKARKIDFKLTIHHGDTERHGEGGKRQSSILQSSLSVPLRVSVVNLPIRSSRSVVGPLLQSCETEADSFVGFHTAGFFSKGVRHVYAKLW